MSWLDDILTRAGDALIGPQMPFGTMGAPMDPRQRQGAIGNALLTLGSTIASAPRQQPIISSIGQGFQNLATQGNQRAMQQLQMGLIGSKIAEQQRANQTREALKKQVPEGMDPAQWGAWVDAMDSKEAAKMAFEMGERERNRKAIGGMGAFPGMGPSASPAGPVKPTGGDYATRTQAVESPFGATNPESGALGYYQFMPDTAHKIAQRTSWGRGMTPDQVRAAILDEVKGQPRGTVGPRQRELFDIYTGDSNSALTAAGLPTSDANRYALHWFGQSGGASLLRADPSTKVGDWVRSVNWGPNISPDAVLQQNRLNPNMTVGELRANITTKMGPGGVTRPPERAVAAAPGADMQDGADGPLPAQPVQYTPSTPADYSRDPVVQEAYTAFRAARTPQEAVAARAKAAERIAALQKEEAAKADRAGTVVELEDGKFLVDPRTGNKIKKIGDRPIPRGEGREFTEEDQLRKEYTTQTKSFQEYRGHYQRILAANEKPSAAGDIAMVYGFMKMLDPTSVVREGEFATAANAGGVDERIKVIYNKLINGERLTDQLRNDFADRAARIFDRAYGEYEATRDVFRKLAESYGRNPDRVTPDFTAGVKRPTIASGAPSAPAAAPMPPAGGTEPPSGSMQRRMRWDGKKLVPVE